MLSKRKRLYYIILSCPLNLCEIGTSEKRKIGINEVSTCTCPTFQSHIIFIHLLLQFGFLKKQALRWRLMSTVYWGVLLGSTPVGEGKVGKEAEWEEGEVGLQSSHNKGFSRHSGRAEARMALQSYPKLRKRGFYIPISISHWTKAVFFSQGNSQLLGE